MFPFLVGIELADVKLSREVGQVSMRLGMSGFIETRPTFANYASLCEASPLNQSGHNSLTIAICSCGNAVMHYILWSEKYYLTEDYEYKIETENSGKMFRHCNKGWDKAAD